jgi:hypothetical protein
MIDRPSLLSDLQKLLKTLEADLLERSESAEVPDVGAHLRQEFEQARQAERTAQNFTDWRSDAITQAAAAWVLSVVFVRFLEDNRLIDPPRIAGPGDRLKRARDEHELYFRAHPTQTDRDYLLNIFAAMASLSGCEAIFGEHNPIHDLPNWLSGDAAGALIAFFQKIEPSTGALVHDFTDPAWDTRFLGDLYQDLSEAARKKYALLQTPVFVEEFILDRTLDPAIEEFGLAKPGYESRLLPDRRLHPDDRFKMIDPACGSGHFLLGSFARLVDRWTKKEPGARNAVLVQRALDSVHGVDVNPFAIAIARFRLLLAALKECGITRLTDAPGFVIHLACGDSLLHGSPGGDQQTMGWAPTDHVYQPEDREALERLLRPMMYHAVVANPPYITPNDSALNAAYRERYESCHRQYSLAVPFLERIISLAVQCGYTGQITANSFMKREFGKKLIENYLPRIDLTHVIDSNGVHLPDHGTPTVMLFARNRKPMAKSIRTVMGIRGEPRTPEDPSRGLVWLAIAGQTDNLGFQNDFISVADLPRENFCRHPWSIGGGGASELKARLEDNASDHLETFCHAIGRSTHVGEDDVYFAPGRSLSRKGLSAFSVPIVFGEDVRDFLVTPHFASVFPYEKESGITFPSLSADLSRYFWTYRTNLRNRIDFGQTVEERGLRWFEHTMFFPGRFVRQIGIAHPNVATHNHFVVIGRGMLFNSTAPVIYLEEDGQQELTRAIALLLNSSSACFWIKQVFQTKGSSGIGRGVYDEPWEKFYQVSGSGLGRFPVPEKRPSKLGTALFELGSNLAKSIPEFICAYSVPSKELVELCRSNLPRLVGELIAAQEELDWECYQLYGVIDEDLCYRGDNLPFVSLGHRAFEIVLARRIADAQGQSSWFDRHNSTRATSPPSEWPEDYRQLIERRIRCIENDRVIRLLEQPEYKRRWNTEPWESQLERALCEWLLDRLESYSDFDGRMNNEGQPTARLGIALTSVGKLADIARQDREFQQVGELYRDDAAFDVTRLVTELVAAESVPLLPILRYKPSGLRKREEWEKTWALQRQDDAIDARTRLPGDHPDHLSELDAIALKKQQVGNIPVPPKYTSADFLNGDTWRLRGKLDVPKERLVSFPHCEGEDGTLMIAWAGYDHLQLARAISAYYVDVQERLGGRDDPRLVPLLAGLIELLPWLKQWHNEVDPEFGVPMGDYFEGFVQEESRNAGLTLEEIKAWQPPQRATGRGRRRTNP